MSTPAITPWPLPPNLRRVVIVGGTFDPPHRAHLALPLAYRDRFEPGAALLFVPAGVSPFKVQDAARTPARHRVAMLRLAIAGIENAAAWTDEVDRVAADPKAPSYTIDTITRAKVVAPGASLVLLIGADQALAFHRWREARRILAEADVRVLLRPPHADAERLLNTLRAASAWNDEELAAWADRLRPGGGMADTLDPASSTEIRHAIARGGLDRVRPLLHPDVAMYIEANGLYGA